MLDIADCIGVVVGIVVVGIAVVGIVVVALFLGLYSL
jgi:hypothetical protein